MAQGDFFEFESIVAREATGVIFEAGVDPIRQPRAGSDDEQFHGRSGAAGSDTDNWDQALCSVASRRAALTSHRLSRR